MIFGLDIAIFLPKIIPNSTASVQEYLFPDVLFFY